ncbi:winged helix-turn-helix transcriptional regulator [Hathewaya limosa]|uniref:DNA-binding HxlR family transcriptional regulator n=1 Tax=Hathewaya limosa TaxID=1536 RepID=A0ABU0JT01_HATLI|nr:helix-turn-helix domain-containing protein [Hathewaya limosa]MDQ0480230.1 DNA-binding HxlR family transcriptional regulator [Hathewaya limosa]
MPKDRKNKVSCSNYISEIEVTLEVISGKWKSLILWNLGIYKIIRFNEFQNIIPSISQKMLTQQLRDLEKNNLINRKSYNQVPPKVEYSLTELGNELIPILEKMNVWGEKFINIFEKE